MQTQKMSLANIQGKLSSTEMKNIMAGSGSGTSCNCNSKDDCPTDKPICYNGVAYNFTAGTYVGMCDK